ncbi:hydrolase [Xanthomonas phage Bosa]|uniref:Hydrolase (HAD superfamily) n=2 Tax=Bosavirus TaxID=2946834 RepID=A0A679K437_9CAUD|nr:hydrolase [Xanthomonas phage Bosa]YP_010739191.1 HAD superfamily hydrolase [Xanthomonas phage vB_Xar_IVIA-DoCa10]ATS92216.1 nucleotide pyrophosphohydrolase [Stenotrophomonas phage DLP4]UYA99044.1 HAD superfamily hydrolase [Xanthomonas phage vB_Xar_IVIA-DoCa10]CAA2409913.1 Hydrolase (HAD superfamily) [Xanthomonas phage Bosa]
MDEIEKTGQHQALVAALVARMLLKAEEFNVKILDTPIPGVPTVLSGERMDASVDALKEEIQEFEDAHSDGDVLEAADALVDLIYFALGRLVEMGVPPLAVFDAVQAANMAKVRGDLSKRPGWNGRDAVKPEGWEPPNHAWLLSFDLSDVSDLQELRKQEQLRESISPVWMELQHLRETKGQDYNNVPGGREAYFPFGHESYAHMLHTKNLRIQSLITAMRQGREPNYEGLYDTARDLVNYGTYYAEWLKLNGMGGDK